jgi:hypothetical protein
MFLAGRPLRHFPFIRLLSVQATSGQGLRQLRPAVISPALHLDVFGDQPPWASVEIVEDSLALRVEAETRLSLAGSRHLKAA